MKKYLFLHDNADNTTAFYHEDQVWDHFSDEADFTYLCSVEASVSSNPSPHTKCHLAEAPIKRNELYDTGFRDFIIVREVYYDPDDATPPPEPVHDPMISFHVYTEDDGAYCLDVFFPPEYSQDIANTMADFHNNQTLYSPITEQHRRRYGFNSTQGLSRAMMAVLELIRQIKTPDSDYYNK